MDAHRQSGRLEREMGLDHADFWRLLPRAVWDHPWRAEGVRALIRVGEGRVEITLGHTFDRRIALLRLPVTPVTIAWHDLGPEAFRAFLDQFDRHYQRGGG
jgi:hypothetical protein